MRKSHWVAVVSMAALVVPMAHADMTTRIARASNPPPLVAFDNTPTTEPLRAQEIVTSVADLAETVIETASAPSQPEIILPAAAPEPVPTPTAPPSPYPSRLSIPSISLNSPIVRVGTNAKGEMDVPSGKANNVGWYEYGTIPGNIGSAVIDAHVYAAFKNLKHVKVGDEIIVTTEGGEKRRFVVSETTVYPLSSVPAEILFNRADDERLNLITCAGSWDASRETYSHRLVVYAQRID